MNNQIVIVNQSSGYQMKDIAMALSEQYSHVVLMAYPKKDIDNFTNVFNGDVVIEPLVCYDRSSTLQRLRTWGMSTIQILWKVLTKYRKADLLLVSNPPFAPLTPLFYNNRFSILIYDIYPDVLVGQNVISNRNPITLIWRKANKRVFKRAERVYTIGSGMKDVLSQYVDSKKISIVPLWPNADLHVINREDNLFVKEHHLEGKFVVMYSGNMGETHRMEVLVDVAMKIDDEDVVFFLVGEGVKKRVVAERIANCNCRNVVLLPYQPLSMLSHSLGAAHVGVVTLDTLSSKMSVPSKTFNLMALGKPLMCIASPDSELGSIVKKYEVGEVFVPEDIDGMVDYIRSLKNNTILLNRYQANSKKASTLFTRDNARLFMNEQ